MNAVTKELNKDLVKKATDASHTATVTMIALGFRQRARRSTTLSSVKYQLTQLKEPVVERDFFAFWKSMEDAGAGSLIIGRRGRQTRFAWNYSLKHIAQVAIEGKDKDIESFQKKMDAAGVNMDSEIISEPTPKAKPIRVAKPKAIAKPVIPGLEVKNVQIRPNFNVFLPKDITAAEIEMLKKAI